MFSPPKGYVLKKESVPFPPTRGERITAITDLLSAGGVHRLTVEAGKPITALRWVKDDYDGLPSDVLVDAVIAATRNGEIEDCPANDSPEALRLLFRGFSMVSKKGLRPYRIAVKSIAHFRQWLNVDVLSDTGEAFCVPIIQHNSVPDDIVLVIASYPEDAEEVVYTVRIDTADSAR